MNPLARHNPWLVVACGAFIVTLAMGVRQSFGLFLQPVGQDLGIGRDAFGFAIAVQNLLWGLAQPFVGALADRYGAGRITAAGALLYAGGLALASAAASTLDVQISLGLMVGVALSATTFVTVLGAVGRVVPPARRSLAFGLTTAGGSLGQFLVVPGAQGLILELGWRSALQVLAAAVAVMLVLGLGIAGRPAVQPGTEPEQGLGAALREAAGHGGYRLLNAGFFVCGFHLAFIGTHLPAFLTDRGLDPRIGAVCLALIGLFNIAGSYLFGVFGGRWRKKYLLSGIYTARALTIALFLAFPLSPMTAMLFAAVMGFLWLGTVPLTSGLLGQIFGVRYLSTLYGIVFLSHQIGSFFGAWMAGVIFDRTGSYDLIWWTSIGLGLFAGLVHLPIRDATLIRSPLARTAAA
ncbi:MFS transporter [Oleisolibacter albus]|uniref:MFS transporter n=1 Tax=Oleisolibacter albus TaxID=2171757 RepID=UPI000DF3D374|nr:MFS transporter [Oleisolibacter albus]